MISALKSSAIQDSARSVADAWLDYRVVLSDFVCSLIVRKDKFGVYEDDGARTWTGDAEKAVCDAYAAGKPIGLCTTSADNRSREVSWDIDNHGDDASQAETNRQLSMRLLSRLQSLGFSPLLENSDGQGGYRIRVMFREKVPTADSYALGMWIAEGTEIESFPKQPHIYAGGVGNWVRAPGPHHTRNWHSEFYDGTQWLSGEAAIEHYLNATMHDAELLQCVPDEFLESRNNTTKPALSEDDIPKLRSGLAALPDSFADNYDLWIEIGQCLNDASGGEYWGFELWLDFSARSSKYDADECEAKWNTFQAEGHRTAATIFYHAKENGWTGHVIDAAKEFATEDTELSTINNCPAPMSGMSLSAQRVRVYVDDNEMATNNNVIDALSGTENLFQMDGRLVQLVRPPKDRVSVSDVLVPHYLTPALLRERITNLVTFHGYDAKGNEVHRTIPKYCAETIHQRGVWEGVPHLAGIVASPVLRPDGSVLQTSGYDVASQLFADLQETYPVVPHDPTAAEVDDSVNLLLDLVCDFPFVNDAHRAAWLAAILTPLAKHTHTGVTGPIMLFDAPTAGSGKTILGELGGIICIGNEPPSMIWKHGETERSKAMLSKLMQRPQIILLDNVECELGGPTINKCVTDRIYEDRVLQKSETAQVPVLAQIWVTGNNVQVVEDTRRRVCHCRIEPSCERPETRDGFKHPDVKGYARSNRKKLLCAALTILRGYFSAGKPKQDLIPWGSFEGWSSVVRSSLVWAGLPDVAHCMMSVNTQDDELLAGMESIVSAFLTLDPEFDGLTTKQVAVALRSDSTTPGRDELVQAFDSLTDQPISKIGSQQVGAALKKLKSKVCGEYKLASGRDNKRRFWVLHPVKKVTPVTPVTPF